MTFCSKYTRALTFKNLFQAIASHFCNAAGDPLWLAIGMLLCVVFVLPLIRTWLGMLLCGVCVLLFHTNMVCCEELYVATPPAPNPCVGPNPRAFLRAAREAQLLQGPLKESI